MLSSVTIFCCLEYIGGTKALKASNGDGDLSSHQVSATSPRSYQLLHSNQEVLRLQQQALDPWRPIILDSNLDSIQRENDCRLSHLVLTVKSSTPLAQNVYDDLAIDSRTVYSGPD